MSGKTDNATLAQIIDDCFMLSVDDRLDLDSRAKFDQLANDLRKQLIVLSSKAFDEGTPALVDANNKIKSVNARLKKFVEDLAGVADTFEKLGKLVSVLDGLLKIPLAFA